MSSLQSNNLYQGITNQIINAIEIGSGDYKMPWNPKLCVGSEISIPHNPIGRYGYRGINILSLWSSQQSNAYETPVWATYRQWQTVGAQVRKGEKGTVTIFFKTSDTSNPEIEGGKQLTRRFFIAKAAYVYNRAQVDNYHAPPPPTLTNIERDAAADAFVQACAASIYHDSDHACYIPSLDEIHLPPKGAFFNSQGYYSVLSHELVHWTGHAKRCALDLRNRFGAEAYAAEELVAELGAAFLCAEFGISSEPRIDHARYIESWLKVLNNDNRAIFTAAAKANQAVTYLKHLTGNT